MTLSFFRTIRDPIWGDIPLTKIENEIIASDAFMRLRHIKQMSMSYLGHHGAHHTRFEHSIGCCHVAYNLIRDIVFDKSTDTILQEIGATHDDDVVYHHVRLAALLHDIGHAPMSHLVESVFMRYPRLLEECREISHFQNLDPDQKEALENYGHEQFSVLIIKKDEEIQSILHRHNIQTDVLTYLIASIGNPSPKFKLYKKIISGDLDADRLDYINRDFYFCGIREVVDLQLLAQALRVYPDNNNDNHLEIRITEEVVLEASSFLFARYRLAQMVHNAPKSRTNEQVFIQLVRNYFNNITQEERLAKLIKLHTTDTDAELLAELATPVDVVKVGNAALTARNLIDGKATVELGVLGHCSHEDLSPIHRFFLHYVSENPRLLEDLEQVIKNSLDANDALIIDLIAAKPSSMELPIHTSEGCKSLFDGYYLPHAIFAVSIRNISIRVLASKEIEFSVTSPVIDNSKGGFNIKQVKPMSTLDPPLKTRLYVEEKVRKALEEVVLGHLESLDSIEKIPNELLLIIILREIKSHAHDNIKHMLTLWVRGDTSFHKFVNSVCTKMGINTYLRNTLGFDIVLFKSLERLVIWGLIDHVHKPVPFKKRGLEIKKYVARVDRMINQWGIDFFEILSKRINKDLLGMIKSEVWQRQNKSLPQLIEYRKIQVGLNDTGELEKHEKLRQIEMKIRDRGGCPLKFR